MVVRETEESAEWSSGLEGEEAHDGVASFDTSVDDPGVEEAVDYFRNKLDAGKKALLARVGAGAGNGEQLFSVKRSVFLGDGDEPEVHTGEIEVLAERRDHGCISSRTLKGAMMCKANRGHRMRGKPAEEARGRAWDKMMPWKQEGQ
jgi:hypothetical protein